MAKMRSPNYPALTLTQAQDAARKLWEREKRTAVDHESAVKAFGYKTLSGPARVAIAAMRQYGLITKSERGHIALSDLAVRLIHGDAADQQKALREAALSPSLFKELSRTHLDASEDAIRSFLITKRGFGDNAATTAAKSFRHAIQLANVTASGYTPSKDEQEPEDMADSDTGQDTGAKGYPPLPGVFSLSVPFAKGTISVQVRVTGDSLRPAHLARVRKYLELAEQDWETEDA